MHKGFDLINPDVEQWNLRVGESHPEIPFVKLKEGKKNHLSGYRRSDSALRQ